LKQEEARFRKAQEARSKAEAEARVIAEQARLESDEEDLSKSFDQPFQVEAPSPENSSLKLSWVRSSPDISEDNPDLLLIEDDTVHEAPSKEIETFLAEEGIISAEDDSSFPSDVLKRLSSPEAGERKAALAEVLRSGGDDAFCHITPAFDDQSADVRNAAARALFDLQSDRAATFTRALREGTPERRRKIGQALAASGLASEAIGNLTGESREKTYDAFSLLFLMAKAGEAQLLMQAIEDYPNLEVRIAVVKLLALSGQPEIVPAFRRLAVRGSLPSEVRSALMEAIYQISSQARESAPSAA
jgi:HEAT repeat protein